MKGHTFLLGTFSELLIQVNFRLIYKVGSDTEICKECTISLIYELKLVYWNIFTFQYIYVLTPKRTWHLILLLFIAAAPYGEKKYQIHIFIH
jgi:hypothetical protein